MAVNGVEETFSRFYENWFNQTEEYLQELVKLSKHGREAPIDVESKALVTKIKIHVQEYYTAKWASAEQDVLIFFPPVWLNSFELTFIWFTDWKPSLMFQIIDSMKNTQLPKPSLTELTDEQLVNIEKLRKSTRSDEEKLERQMERLQVSMADNKTVDLVRLGNRFKRNRASSSQVNIMVGARLNGIIATMEKAIKSADCTRLKAIKGILEILSPTQSVDFLIEKFMIQVRLRNEGRKIATDS